MNVHSWFWPGLLALGLLASAARAAEPLEEVIVRAGFKEAQLFKSMGSISVLDAQQVSDRAAQHLEDTLNVLPNVSFSSGGSRARFLQVRGVGDLEQFVDPKHFPSVGIVVDGIEMSGVATAALLMDVDQIELLRGPQGTRFGSSALAGMINISSRDAGDELDGNVEAGVGNYDTWHLNAAVGGPLSDHLQGRLAVRQYQSDGFIDNRFLGRDDTNHRDELAARGKLRWFNDRGLRVDLIGLYFNIDNGYDAFSLDNQRSTLADQPGEDTQESHALGGKAVWQASPDFALEAMLNRTDSDETYGFDEDWVFAGFCDGVRCDPAFEFSSTDTLVRDRQQTVLDVRMLGQRDVLGWVAGAYAQGRDEELQRQRFGSFSSAYETQRYAVYGQLDWQFSERWQLTAGIRYEHFEDDYYDSNALLTDSQDDFWAGDVSLSYSLSDQTLLYATFARGVKPGGVNTEASSTLPFMAALFQSFVSSRLRFDTETLFNKEIGWKGRYFDDRFSFRAAAFHMDRNDAQLESWMWDATNFLWVGLLDSVDSAENYGVELELEYSLNNLVELFAAIGYLQTNIDEITAFDLNVGDFVTRRDREQAKAPLWQYNIGANLSFGERLSGRIEVEGQDKSSYGYYHDEQIDAYAILNASLSYQFQNVDLQIWGRNLLDEDYYVHGLFFANDPRNGFLTNQSYYQFGEPRIFGVNLSYSF